MRLLAGQRAKLDGPVGLVRFVSIVVHRTLEGEITPDVARAVVYALMLQRQLIEATELERRLRVVEQRLTRARVQSAQARTNRWG